MFHRSASRLRVMRASAALLCWVAPLAAVAAPTTVAVEGVLQSAGAGPVADGSYDITFAVYVDAKATTPLWEEGPVSVPLFGGRFSYVLGTKKPIVIGVLAAASAPMFSVRVAKDPELPRRALQSTLFALHAASATMAATAGDLACTGCVSVSEMKFDGDVSLGAFSLKAKNGTFTGALVANTVTATAFAGDGAKLTNLPIPKGTCPKDQVVRGIAADGSLLCVVALSGKNLPSDGLASVSNGLLTNQFVETLAAAGLPAIIPDNTGTEASAKVIVPDLGLAQGLSVQVAVSNSDLGSLRLVLLPPNDKKTGLTLCDPCGATDAKALSTSFPDKTKTKTGDLGVWIGNNPKGEWLLKALDSKFCVVQAPGNKTICDTTKKTDGVISGFAVKVDVLSSKKAGVTGLLQLALMAKPPVDCAVSLRGSIFYDTSANGVRYCDGKNWRLLSDTCGNGILDLAEECDDGNNVSGDGCSATCVAGLGASAQEPGLSCKTILAAATTSKSGTYWLDLDGAGSGAAAQYLCDMTKDGGGWTRVYAELPMTASGWSTTKNTTAKVNNVSSAVHGPFGKGETMSKKIDLAGMAHTQLRISGRYFAIDSWDGEHARVLLDGTTVFDRAKVYSGTGGAGWTTVTFTPSPWTGPAVDGFWDLWAVAGIRSHTATSVTVALTSTIDQDISDESWLADQVAIWAR